MGEEGAKREVIKGKRKSSVKFLREWKWKKEGGTEEKKREKERKGETHVYSGFAPHFSIGNCG